MKNKYNLIIGISGNKGSGKDTVASMLHYIATVGIAAANFRDWTLKYELTNKKIEQVVHFADSLKDILSILFNINREYFDNRIYKDSLYFNYNERKFDIQEDVTKNILNNNAKIINIEDLKDFSFSYYLSKYSIIYIKLRTLLQYFGTNLIRYEIDDNIWIYRALDKAQIIAKTNVLCIILDVRFINEADIIIAENGYVIKINKDNIQIDDHESENLDKLNKPYIIQLDNNKTKMVLFYNVLEIYKQIYSKIKNK